jgi:hypothetical protein
MTDVDAQGPPFPETATVLAYVEMSFEAVESSFAAIDDEELIKSAQLKTAHGPIQEIITGEIMTSHLAHVSRRLGMIEALIGVMGEHGTATM